MTWVTFFFFSSGISSFTKCSSSVIVTEWLSSSSSTFSRVSFSNNVFIVSNKVSSPSQNKQFFSTCLFTFHSQLHTSYLAVVSATNVFYLIYCDYDLWNYFLSKIMQKSHILVCNFDLKRFVEIRKYWSSFLYGVHSVSSSPGDDFFTFTRDFLASNANTTRANVSSRHDVFIIISPAKSFSTSFIVVPHHCILCHHSLLTFLDGVSEAFAWRRRASPRFSSFVSYYSTTHVE